MFKANWKWFAKMGAISGLCRKTKAEISDFRVMQKNKGWNQ